MDSAETSAPPVSVESRRIEFESGRVVDAICAGDHRLLREAEEGLDVRLTTREGWIRIEGEPESVARAEAMLRRLEGAHRSGVQLRKQDFRYALRAAAEGGEGEAGSGHFDSRVIVSPRKPPIIARTAAQRTYLQAIRTHDIVFGIGPAGTGKTYLAMAAAVEALKRERVTRIILTRPAVEAGEALGFLPGDLNEKIFPYLRPLYDALHDMLDAEEIQRYTERGVVEVAPLAYMRGRTLNHAFVILDEAQNTTTEQMFMFLTRLGADSRAVITGDRIEGIHFQRFEERDVIRHELVQSIIRAYQTHRGAGQG
jgi:phosphate starvation-inducible PhoH-like protein